ncbi:Glycerophosphoryl diester phosphodiesterase [Variovorax sp. SRS16]|uniref:glycerophosphodiester phosphodiesterase n=1 Tax=Variovorax sp. SRS16 TaxID=282217 RepID=UPI0013184654|nr:glycerophosphodiester phosphodiesterase [Variovorax sp. SRS16]VTU24231.1 Glycerophosphoryl diester phosphodiesterase [Variovorax sp. SRS16]
MKDFLSRAALRRGAARCAPWLMAASLLAGCAASGRDAPYRLDLEAHRGGRALAPENTLTAFSNAVGIGVTTLELDIGLTADGVVVISHDMALNPDHTRDATGAFLKGKGPPIHALTLAQLQTYDVGRIDPASSYGKPFPHQVPHDGERIPTLAALFERMHQLGANQVRFNIETKVDPTQPDLTAAPEPMVRALLAEIDRAGVASRVTIQSFDWRTLALVGQWAPQLPRAYLTSARTVQDSRWTAGLRLEDAGSPPKLVRKAAGDGKGMVVWSPSFNDLSAPLVQEAHVLGLQVLPWTVDRRADMERLMDWGVDGIITDDPVLLREVMSDRRIALPAALGR